MGLGAYSAYTRLQVLCYANLAYSYNMREPGGDVVTVYRLTHYAPRPGLGDLYSAPDYELQQWAQQDHESAEVKSEVSSGAKS